MKTTVLILAITIAALMTQEVYAENESRRSTRDSKSRHSEKRNALGQIVKMLYQDLESQPWFEDKHSAEKRDSQSSNCATEAKAELRVNTLTERENPEVYYDMISLLKPFLLNKDLNKDTEKKLYDVDKNKSINVNERIGRKQDQKSIKNVEDKANPKADSNGSSKHFLLSLLEDFDDIPKNMKVEAKYDILSVLKKYTQHVVSNSSTTTTVYIAPRSLINRDKEVPTRFEDVPLSDPSLLSDIFS